VQWCLSDRYILARCHRRPLDLDHIMLYNAVLDWAAARPGCTRGLGKASGAQAISRQAAESQASHRGPSHATRSVTERRPGLGNGEDRHMTTIQWTDNFATACQQAGQDQKLVLLDFFSPT
jgi:hypothetical protein